VDARGQRRALLGGASGGLSCAEPPAQRAFLVLGGRRGRHWRKLEGDPTAPDRHALSALRAAATALRPPSHGRTPGCLPRAPCFFTPAAQLQKQQLGDAVSAAAAARLAERARSMVEAEAGADLRRRRHEAAAIAGLVRRQQADELQATIEALWEGGGGEGAGAEGRKAEEPPPQERPPEGGDEAQEAGPHGGAMRGQGRATEEVDSGAAAHRQRRSQEDEPPRPPV
jgi:hypothetical protein